MLYGYAGKVLIVDLTDQTYEIQELREDWARLFIGGAPLGARYLYELMPANTPVFAPESVVGFVSGPANATRALMGGRFVVCSKCPVTGGLNDCNGGGNFAPYMKKAGFDAIFVKGISEKPVYLFVDDGKVSFHDASNVWGKTIRETENLIREEVGYQSGIGFATIGVAGENLSYMAAVMSDQYRPAARGGSGAVIGSKKLKAVVCHGTGNISVADEPAILELNKKAVEYKKVAPPCLQFPQVGTANGYLPSVKLADCGIKNWAGFPEMMPEDGVIALNASATDEKYKTGRYACHNCYIGCGAKYHVVDDNLGLDFEGFRPEYETIAAFGSNIMNVDAACMLACNYYCNEYAFDTLSVGGTISWAMECYEHGVLTKDDLDGIDLTWGNAKAILEFVRKICYNEGCGKVFINGSQYAADQLGKGHEYLCTYTGIEPHMHGSRLNPAMARTSQYDPTPGRHTRGGRGVPFKMQPPELKYDYDNDQYGQKDADSLWEWEFDNCTGFCSFSDFLLPPGPPTHLGYVNAITGSNIDMPALIKLGKRTYTVRHLINIRDGLYRDHWTVSDRLMGRPPVESGPIGNVTVDNEKLADRFFEAMGFDVKTAIPSKETLHELELDFAIPDLYPED